VRSRPGRRGVIAWSLRTLALVTVAAVATVSGFAPAQAQATGAPLRPPHPGSPPGGTTRMQTITLSSGVPTATTRDGLDASTSFCVLGDAPGFSTSNTLYSYAGPALPPAPSDCLTGYPAHPYVTAFYSTVIAGTQWVAPSPTASDSQLPPPANQPVYYVYDAEFQACPTKGAPLSAAHLAGSMLADNAAGVYLNGHFIAATPGSLSSSHNFTIPTAFAAPPPAGAFVAGTNVLDFVVEDASQPETGLDYTVTVTVPACGQVKICKVAGFGVTVGTPVAFTLTDPPHPPVAITVPAGPAPGGYCQLAGYFPLGANVMVHEGIPPGDVVSAITVAPPARQIGAPNLSSGTVHVRVGPGVTEVSYTDAMGQTGYLEICKVAPPSSTGTAGDYQFIVGSQTVTVPAGACSPPVQVLAGVNTVTEVGGSMYACSTSPPAALIGCNFTAQTATVTVAPGGVASETILTVTNAPAGTAGA
jgi:hypothetical protein